MSSVRQNIIFSSEDYCASIEIVHLSHDLLTGVQARNRQQERGGRDYRERWNPNRIATCSLDSSVMAQLDCGRCTISVI